VRSGRAGGHVCPKCGCDSTHGQIEQLEDESGVCPLDRRRRQRHREGNIRLVSSVDCQMFESQYLTVTN